VFASSFGEEVLPVSVLNYNLNTKKRLLLKSACQEGDFILDPYIRERRCLSLLSVPLLFDGEVSGVLVLEHSETPGLFTPYQVNLVELLLTQYLISHNNSILYQSVQAHNAALEDQVVIRTRELQQKTDHLEAILASLPLPYAVTRTDGSVIEANSRFSDQFGRDRQLPDSMNLFDLYPASLDRQEMLDRLFSDGTITDIECQLKAAQGKPFWAQISSTLIQQKSERVIFTVIRDISERKHREHMLRMQATTDPLTGVLNRRAFLNVSGSIREEGDEADMVLAMADLDHFKNLNDTYGHAAGDEVLKGFAKLVSNALRDKDLFARIGGEEFVIVLVGVSLEQATNILERIRYQLQEARFRYKEGRIGVTASIGATPWMGGEPVTQAMERADQALYKAKNGGRNRITIQSAL
jgi:diguanylate cyclase (GGDEF)-like protein/PAS domain S-box-containing protein